MAGKKKPVPGEKLDLEAAIIKQISAQAKLLVGRQFPDIKRIMDAEGEVKLSLGVTLRNREPEPGNEAGKDSQIRTVLSFSEKFSDSTESEMPNPEQPELPGAGEGGEE